MSDKPTTAFLKALREGAPEEELVQLLNQVNPDEMSDEEFTTFRNRANAASENQFDSLWIESSFQTGRVKTGTAPIIGPAGFAGPGIAAKGGALTPSVRSIAAEVTEEAVRNKIKDPNLIKNVLSFIGKHKKGLTATGIAGAGLAFGSSAIPGIQEGGEPGSSGGPPVAGPDPSMVGVKSGSWFSNNNIPDPRSVSIAQASQVDRGFNVLVIDRDGSLTGVPGQVAIIPPDELGAQSGLSPQLVNDIANTLSFGAGPGRGGIAGADLMQGVVAQGVSGLQIDNRIKQVISPITMGQVTISAPVQTLTQPSARINQGGGGTSDLIGGRPAPGAATGQTGPTTYTPNESIDVPAGAKIAPRVFQEYRGRSLLEWAGITAQKYGIPLNILYGIIDHESNWNPNAVGDNGNSHGLAQIYMKVWGGQVSTAQARDPVFALEWTAKMLKQRFNQYGRWDAAIAAHNSPVAADHLARTGKFLTEKSASYVGDVMGRSNTSGLDNYTFAEDSLMGIGIEGEGSGQGVSYTPYQSPDPAASREFVEATYQEMLGRKPTEEEFEREVGRIAGLSRQQYNANLKQAKGGQSQATDVEAQFREGIKGTGEFAFTEDTHQLDSFTDYAAGVARLLQQGL